MCDDDELRLLNGRAVTGRLRISISMGVQNLLLAGSIRRRYWPFESTVLRW